MGALDFSRHPPEKLLEVAQKFRLVATDFGPNSLDDINAEKRRKRFFFPTQTARKTMEKLLCAHMFRAVHDILADSSTASTAKFICFWILSKICQTSAPRSSHAFTPQNPSVFRSLLTFFTVGGGPDQRVPHFKS